ncbi:hypothetical protein RUM43_012366 [Polyplax serrata]|uniref:Uncharacterized protein n=1 Tax=Polyplax serrata TaxID=468196 RepID=A0AAN8NKK3_POLSC
MQYQYHGRWKKVAVKEDEINECKREMKKWGVTLMPEVNFFVNQKQHEENKIYESSSDAGRMRPGETDRQTDVQIDKCTDKQKPDAAAVF